MAWFDFLNAANERGRDAGSIARQRLSARAGIPASRVPAPRGGGLNPVLFNPVTAAYSIPGFAEQRERNMDYVREQNRGPLNELNYIGGQLLQGRLPYTPTSIQNRPVVNPRFLRPDYSGAGERARRFQEYRLGTDIPGANTDYSSRLGRAVSPASPAAERAYRQEVSSVAQQAAQNPELQRYEKERAAAAASKDQGKMDAVRDLGMQIWAQKYGKPGGLASKVKPGQAGYDVIQRTLFSQGTSLPPLSEASQAMLNEIAPINAQGVRENIMPMPGQMPVFSEASEAMYQAVTDGGKLVTPMPSPQAKMTQEAAAQSLADAYKSSIVGDDEFAQRLRAMQQYMQ